MNKNEISPVTQRIISRMQKFYLGRKVKALSCGEVGTVEDLQMMSEPMIRVVFGNREALHTLREIELHHA